MPPWPQVFDNKLTQMIDRQVSPAFTRWSAIIIAVYQYLPRVPVRARYYRSLPAFTPCVRERWHRVILTDQSVSAAGVLRLL